MVSKNSATEEGVSTEDAQKPRVNLDTILIEEIGQFGRYQIRILILTVVLIIFTAFAAMEYIFTTGRTSTRCLIPECEGSDAADFSPSWILNAVPVSGSSFDNCRRFFPSNVTTKSNECPSHWFNHDAVVPCSDFVYENTNTVVYEYGLACDEWRRTMIGSIRTVGTLTSLPITGFISDHWGRRVALSLNAVNTAWLGIVRYWARSYYGFLISEVVESTFGAGAFSCAYILVMELVGPKYRVIAGAFINTFFSLGQILLGLMAWAVPSWKNLTLALYVPQLMLISYFWIMSESVRWYLSKGRYEDAEVFLRNVARVNRKELSEKSLRALKENAESEKAQKTSAGESKAQEPWLVVLVFQHRAMLRRCCVSPIWWITSALVYYGMSVNAVNMSGNRHINFIAVAASEIPGYWIAVILLDRIGRKPVLIGAYWTCAACQLAYIFIPDNMYGVSLMVYLIGKFSIAIVMMSLYIYTAEIYPTRYRHTLLAFSSMIGRIGSIIAPLTPAFGAAIWHHFPSALFLGFAFTSGALVFLTPETLGTKLPDTMEEASQIGVK